MPAADKKVAGFTIWRLLRQGLFADDGDKDYRGRAGPDDANREYR